MKHYITTIIPDRNVRFVSRSNKLHPRKMMDRTKLDQLGYMDMQFGP